MSGAIPKNLTFCFPGNFSVKKLYIYIVVVVVKRVVNDRQEMNCTLVVRGRQFNFIKTPWTSVRTSIHIGPDHLLSTTKNFKDDMFLDYTKKL